MFDFKFRPRNILMLVLAGFSCLLTGFAFGAFWAGDLAAGTRDLVAEQSLVSTKMALIGKEDRLRSYEQELAELRTELFGLKSRLGPLAAAPEVRQPAVAGAETEFQPDEEDPTPVPAPNFVSGDLLEAVNKYRRERGISELSSHVGLCQLASRRMGEILAVGDLDDHAGFDSFMHNPGIRGIQGPGLSTVSENLASGYGSAWDTVMGWDGSQPHRDNLLANASFRYGCAAANGIFFLLIGGY